MDTQKSNNDWSDEELEASVDGYLKMLKLENIGQSFNKKFEHELLREGALGARSLASVDYRMRNISAVFEMLNQTPIAGYAAAKMSARASYLVSAGCWRSAASLNLKTTPPRLMKHYWSAVRQSFKENPSKQNLKASRHHNKSALQVHPTYGIRKFALGYASRRQVFVKVVA